MADISYELMERNNLAADDVAWLVPHQANLRIIDATANRMGLPREKVMINIEKYGNTNGRYYPALFVGMGKEIKKRRQYNTGCFWRWIYLGLLVGEMGLRHKLKDQPFKLF